MQICWLHRRGLVAYLDGTLGQRSAQRLVRHLQTCPTCQRELVEMQRVTRLLHSLPSPSRPPAYWSGALQRLQATLQQRPPQPIPSSWFDYLTGSADHPAHALVSVALLGMALFGTVTFLGLEDAALTFLTSYFLPIILQ